MASKLGERESRASVRERRDRTLLRHLAAARANGDVAGTQAAIADLLRTSWPRVRTQAAAMLRLEQVQGDDLDDIAVAAMVRLLFALVGERDRTVPLDGLVRGSVRFEVYQFKTARVERAKNEELRDPAKVRVVKTIRALLIPIIASGGLAFATTAAVAPAAHATSTTYECPNKGSCAKTTGPEEVISNNTAENLSGEGVCSAFWWYDDGWLEHYNCGERPGSEKRQIVCSSEELVAHGESRRYFAAYEYKLWGWETNILDLCF